MNSVSAPTFLFAQRDRAIAAMNRGYTAQTQADLPAALAAYDEAIALFRTLSLETMPTCANSLGAALMNRGQLLHRLHGVTRAGEALASFSEAEQHLADLPADIVPWAPRNLAGTLLNRANLLLDLQRDALAAADARRALALVRAHERHEPIDAELALKARRVLCDALGRRLPHATSETDALATEAGDLADDALALLRHWRSQGGEARELTVRFFRFGAQLYRRHQPHFLAEFIRENLTAGDTELRTIASEIIQQALDDRSLAPTFLIHGDAATERHLATVRELTALADEITARPLTSCLHA